MLYNDESDNQLTKTSWKWIVTFPSPKSKTFYFNPKSALAKHLGTKSSLEEKRKRSPDTKTPQKKKKFVHKYYKIKNKPLKV